jgi:hypothetical protein
MIVIFSMSKLPDGQIQLGVAKPQHNSKPVQSYSSEKEVRKVLLNFGVDDEAADLYLFELLSQLSPNQELTFPPMDVPQHELVSQGFEIDARPHRAPQVLIRSCSSRASASILQCFAEVANVKEHRLRKGRDRIFSLGVSSRPNLATSCFSTSFDWISFSERDIKPPRN